MITQDPESVCVCMCVCVCVCVCVCMGETWFASIIQSM
jgi:hypothetical protein